MTHLSTPSLFAKSKVEVFDPVHFVCIPGFEAAVRFYCTCSCTWKCSITPGLKVDRLLFKIVNGFIKTHSFHQDLQHKVLALMMFKCRQRLERRKKIYGGRHSSI